MRILNAKGFGAVLVVVWLLSSIQLVFAQAPHVIFAFCYIGILIAGLGFLYARPSLVYAYVSVALLAQIPFSIDLVRVYLGLEQFIGLVMYDPAYHTLAGRIVDLGVHLLVLPFVLVGMRSIEVPTYRSFVKWYLILFVAVIAVSVPLENNCVLIGCFEPLAYGDTIIGHLVYFSIVALIGPLVIARVAMKVHAWLRQR